MEDLAKSSSSWCFLKAKEDYFDNVLKENQSEKYEVIGLLCVIFINF